MTVGDRRLAATLAERALRAADDHTAELRHPERAAAWLRERVASEAPRRVDRIDVDERLAALGPLGVTSDVLAGLAALDRRQRAALLASWVERLDRRDVAVIVHRDGRRLEALLHAARERYLAGSSAAAAPGIVPDGPLIDLVRSTAARTLG